MQDLLAPDFVMDTFLSALPAFIATGEGQEDAAVDGNYRTSTLPETLDVLNHFTSFEAFKEDMLEAKRAKREEAEAVADGMALYFSVAQPKTASRH